MAKSLIGLIGGLAFLAFTCVSCTSEAAKIEKGKLTPDMEIVSFEFNHVSPAVLVVTDFGFETFDYTVRDFSPAMCVTVIEPVKYHDPDTPYFRYWDKNFAYNNYVKPNKIEILMYSMAYSC